MDDEIHDQIFQIAEKQAPSVDELRSISNLVQDVGDLEAEILATEEHLKELNKKLLTIKMIDLPEAMAAAKTSYFVTDNGGLEVTVDTFIQGSVPKDEVLHNAAIKYIDENGGSGIITADVTLKFGRQNAARAREVLQLYRNRDDCSASIKEDVNHMTLKKWCRERLEQGLPVDGEKCGLFIGRIATVKEIKPKKAK